MGKALYRKYRPSKFSEVSGQDHITSVLKESVKKASIVHAYLFSGSRGTGKTSIARIFAKELKCEDEDIYEIDAASHTGVDDIRALNEAITTYPISSKYKVYILDEVHMFSKSAFNALLKTLEEPPAHIIFILATTELEKVPETIRSRCQHFSFKKPSQSTLKKVITASAKSEGFELSEPSVALIAMLADGSFRDAYGVLQKILLVADKKKVPHKIVEQVLGIPSRESVNMYLEALIDSDVKKGIDVLEKEASSTDMKVFCELAVRKLRAALLFQRTQDKALFEDFLDEDLEFLKDIASNEKLSLDTLNKLLKAYVQIQSAYIKQLPLEIAIL